MKTRIVCLLLGFVLGVTAQEQRPWEQYLNEVMTAEDAESEAWEQTYELLCELEQHPMDINRVKREQLEELPFLSAQQIEGIMEYLWRYGRMESLSELTMIRQLDYAQRRLLTYFIYIDEREADNDRQKPPKAKDVMKYGHHELIASGSVEPFRHWLRYQFSYGDQMKAGIVGAQDAGEPFFKGQNRWGYDYYSLYLQLRNVGRIESLVVGHYRVSMGMGLVMNNSFSLGKVAMLQNLGRTTYSVRAHSSRSTGALRGLATTVDMGKSLRLTAFASYMPVDATLNKDGTAATILKTDYHRTETEMNKKHNLNIFKTGGSLRYDNHGIHLGANLLYTHLDRPLKPNTSVLYRRHYPQGSDFTNMSLDYGYACHLLAFSGETAIDQKGHLATINSVSLQISDVASVMALQRFYAYAYSSLDAQSYSDGGKVQNESGIYLGLTWKPIPALHLTAYTDYAWFAWAKYRVSQSSYSWDNLMQGTLQKKSWQFSARYRLRLRQRDNADKTNLENRWEHRARMSADYTVKQGFGGRLQADGYQSEGNLGWMVSGNLSLTHKWLRLNGGAGYFHTDNYDSRLYLYELGPLYTYSMKQFYGEGIRYWLMARANIAKRLLLTLKGSMTNHQADLDFQVRVKL